MGEKDIAEKILLAYNDVFSDIVNVLLFGGQEVIQGNDLEDQTTISAYKADGKLVICGWHAWALKIRQAQIQICR